MWRNWLTKWQCSIIQYSAPSDSSQTFFPGDSLFWHLPSKSAGIYLVVQGWGWAPQANHLPALVTGSTVSDSIQSALKNNPNIALDLQASQRCLWVNVTKSGRQLVAKALHQQRATSGDQNTMGHEQESLILLRDCSWGLWFCMERNTMLNLPGKFGSPFTRTQNLLPFI